MNYLAATQPEIPSHECYDTPMQHNDNKKKRSPLTSAPLRNPGQSLDEEIERVLEGEVSSYLLIGTFILVMAIYEWFRWYTSSPPQPIVFTIAALIITPYAIWRLLKARKKLQALKQGRDGEKAVGQYLDRLREKGYHVLHDIVGNNFNVDHVLVGPAGVFTIETKTISKPVRGEAVIQYDCETINISGYTPPRNPIIQSKAQSAWVREIIEEGTGKRFNVQPVVVYPGWYVKRSPEGVQCNVLVLNPKILPAILENSETRLSVEDTKMIHYHLSRYIRTKE